MRTPAWILALGLTAAGCAAPRTDLPADHGYLDLKAANERFFEKLGEFVTAKTATAPAVLARQAGEQKHFPMSAAQDRGRSLPPADLYARARPSVVAIAQIYKCGKCSRWHGGSATGFIVRKDGLIVTNFHVVGEDGKGEALGVMLADGRVFPILSVLAADRLNDVAIVKIAAENLPALPIAPDVPIGGKVYCLSHPVQHFFTFTEGQVSGKFIEPEHRGQVRQLAITADYAKGSSGGPILNENGAVVGMVRSTSSVYYNQEQGEDRNIQMVWKLCVPSGAILDLMKPKPETASAPATPR